MHDRQDRPSPIDDVEDSNRSTNPTFADVVAVNQGRRALLGRSIGLAAAGVAGSLVSSRAHATADSGFNALLPQDPMFSADQLRALAGRPSFTAVDVGRTDAIVVPSGYTARPLFAWGEPLSSRGPAYRDGGLNTGAEQEQQIGQNHDGMHYFPLVARPGRPNRGLLVFNNEYIDQATLHPNGQVLVDGKRLADDVRKEIAAHGVTIIEIDESNGWHKVDSPFARRITGATPMEIGGPARGHRLLRTAYSQAGTATRGTFNNCGNGWTPWGTYLTCEENWAGYFVNNDATPPREHARYGVPRGGSNYRWETVDARFDAGIKAASATADHRNEPNTHGWIVEIDPFDPLSTPVKRTALGRFGHEGCWVAPPRTGMPYVFYMGDDARHEYIYKFVTRAVHVPLASQQNALDHGTLYVARFNDDGTGTWLPLDIENAGFLAAAAAAGVEFSDQGEVLINARLAADAVGATKMDRPEWGAVDPLSGMVYFTLTNNSARTAAQTNGANPRGPNPYGHILRWRESGDVHHALSFRWDIFLLAGPQDDSAMGASPSAGRLGQDAIHASPDGLWFDRAGLLWIQTDMSGNQLAAGPFGNNQMLTADPATGTIKRFLTGPIGCEVTGIAMTPDLRTLFVNIQHPGEAGGSHWPDGGTARPRSATVVVTKDDGGVIGS